jgi:2,3-dihydroxybenzoate decarboxylase
LGFALVLGALGLCDSLREHPVLGPREVAPVEGGRHVVERAGDYLGSNVVITNSGVFSPAALTGALLEMGADAVMFSVDYPYESCGEAVAGFERTTLSDADREKIAHGNAERILRL